MMAMVMHTSRTTQQVALAVHVQSQESLLRLGLPTNTHQRQFSSLASRCVSHVILFRHATCVIRPRFVCVLVFVCSAHTAPCVFRCPKVPLVTKFLALDKCQHRRHFLQVLEIPCRSDGGGGGDDDAARAAAASGLTSQPAAADENEDANEIDLESAEADAPEESDQSTAPADEAAIKKGSCVAEAGVEPGGSLELCYDAEWLAIVQKTHSLLTRQARLLCVCLCVCMHASLTPITVSLLEALSLPIVHHHLVL